MPNPPPDPPLNVAVLKVPVLNVPVLNVTVLGVGLLGGSVAAALKRLPTPPRVVGWARSQHSQAELRQFGFLDEVSRSVPEACRVADVVVVATPVDTIADLVCEAAEGCRPDVLITDVGSTKRTITQAVERTAAAKFFVAAHPIAGSEQSGAAAARSDLFDGKLTVLTPGREVDRDRVGRCAEFWQSVGCRTIEMPPEEHDRSLAAVSHVPHLIAAVIAMTSPAEALDLVGSGWRDITRVAAGDAAMWTAIVRENRTAISQQLGAVSQEISTLQTIIDQADDATLREWLLSAAKIRARA